MATILIDHGTLITVDPQRRIIENGALAIEDDRVVAAGPREAVVSTREFDQVIDASRMVVLPGLIEGWTCHAGWSEYRGLNAPDDQPVLSLLARDDPWFKADYLRGECGRFMRPDNGSRAVVFDQPELRAGHCLLHAPEPREHVLTFLRQWFK